MTVCNVLVLVKYSIFHYFNYDIEWYGDQFGTNVAMSSSMVLGFLKYFNLQPMSIISGSKGLILTIRGCGSCFSK